MTATDTSLDIIQSLDFEATLGCEHHRHNKTHLPDEPARWIVKLRCPKCGHEPAVFLLCERGRQLHKPPRTVGHVGSSGCGFSGYWDDFVVYCDAIKP